jgi:trans-aconitate methyltransferase
MANMQKDLWNATLYDTQHAFVTAYGNTLLPLLNAQSNEAILDVGCGTGDLASTIAESGAHVTGIDFSANMIEQAKEKYPALTFAVQDATCLPYTSEFDAVFSNAALHWMKQPIAVIESIFNSLKTGGRFVAEFGGADNVSQITTALITNIKDARIPYTNDLFPWYFPTIGEYTTLLEAAGFRVMLAQHYDRPTKLNGEDGMRDWLEMFSPSLFEQVEMEVKEAVFTKTVEQLRPALYKEGEWFADYKRLRIVAVKQ